MTQIVEREEPTKWNDNSRNRINTCESNIKIELILVIKYAHTERERKQKTKKKRTRYMQKQLRHKQKRNESKKKKEILTDNINRAIPSTHTQSENSTKAKKDTHSSTRTHTHIHFEWQRNWIRFMRTLGITGCCTEATNQINRNLFLSVFLTFTVCAREKFTALGFHFYSIAFVRVFLFSHFPYTVFPALFQCLPVSRVLSLCLVCTFFYFVKTDRFVRIEEKKY